MSSTSDSDFRVFVKRVELMIWTLLFPEMIILWAFRQWSGARALCMKYEGYGWTMRHGFLLQMGGFVERSEDGNVRVLRSSDLQKWILQHKRVPIVTVQKITARSKSDARRINGLFITPAELSTLAFAVLNSVMYFLWSHKPLDCRIPVELHANYPGYPGYPGYPKTILTKETFSYLSSLNFKDDNEAAAETLDIVSYPPSSGSGVQVQYINPKANLTEEPLSDVRTTKDDNEAAGETLGASSIVSYPPSSGSGLQVQYINPKANLTVEPSFDVGTTNGDKEAATESLGTSSIVPYPLTESESISGLVYIDTEEGLLRRILLFPYRRLGAMRTSISFPLEEENHSQVPMFYAYTPGGITRYKTVREDLFFGHIVIGIVCLAFGGMHILAWSIEFPSCTERLLWRICSVAITALPVIYVTPILLLRPFLPSSNVAYGNISIANKLVKVLTVFQLAIPPIYFLARLFLIIEVVIALRTLPSSAFLNITWTTYIPHL